MKNIYDLWKTFVIYEKYFPIYEKFFLFMKNICDLWKKIAIYEKDLFFMKNSFFFLWKKLFPRRSYFDQLRQNLNCLSYFFGFGFGKL